MPKLLPSRTKYRKVHRGRVRGIASKGNKVSFGEFGIQSLSRGRMTSNQIEAARVAINRHLKRKGKVWIRVFSHKPVTKKPAETRQGKGKGPVDHWVAVIKPGHVLFETHFVHVDPHGRCLVVQTAFRDMAHYGEWCCSSTMLYKIHET